MSFVGRKPTDAREWLSGRASPCQGEGRGSESRLALLLSRPVKGAAFLLFTDAISGSYPSAPFQHFLRFSC